MDGHSGISNDEKNRGGDQRFDLVLSLLKDSYGSRDFIIHATSHVMNFSSSFSPEVFLQRIGYQHFGGNCPYHHNSCLWLHLASFEPDSDGRGFFDAERYHTIFKGHAAVLGDVYASYQAAVDKLRVSRTHEIDLFPELSQRVVPTIAADPNVLPDWVVSAMSNRFSEVTSEIATLQAEQGRLLSIAGLLWQNDALLEEAVHNVFQNFGYRAQRTPQGETYDIEVELDAERKLIIEVTGLTGALKKDSGKISQVLQVIQKHKRDTDRVVIALNNHRTEPLAERPIQDAVTKDALALLTGMGVVIVTTPDLFNIWQESQSNLDYAKSQIEQLYATEGGIYSKTA